MKKYFILIMTISVLSSLFIVNNVIAQQACTVSENYDREDSSGLHFNVYDSAGEYLGYVTQSEDNDWSAWIDGSGALNTVFDSKEASADAVCLGDG